jgi:transposase
MTHYTKEFKEKAVNLCLNSDKPDKQIAQDLGVKYSTLTTWKRQYLKKHPEKNTAIGQELTEAEKIKRLQKQLAIAEEERDILKKALAIFSSQKDKFTR